MRRIKQYTWNEVITSSPVPFVHIISERDFKLMRAVVRAAETIRKDRECTIVLARALDAFNKTVKS